MNGSVLVVGELPLLPQDEVDVIKGDVSQGGKFKIGRIVERKVCHLTRRTSPTKNAKPFTRIQVENFLSQAVEEGKMSKDTKRQIIWVMFPCMDSHHPGIEGAFSQVSIEDVKHLGCEPVMYDWNASLVEEKVDLTAIEQ